MHEIRLHMHNGVQWTLHLSDAEADYLQMLMEQGTRKWLILADQAVNLDWVMSVERV